MTPLVPLHIKAKLGSAHDLFRYVYAAHRLSHISELALLLEGRILWNLKFCGFLAKLAVGKTPIALFMFHGSQNGFAFTFRNLPTLSCRFYKHGPTGSARFPQRIIKTPHTRTCHGELVR